MLRITVLCDNVVGFPLGIAEHGFSAYVETEGGPFLFDTGGGRGIVSNAMVFGKDLRAVKKIFISHGHFDHTAGLPEVLGLCRGAEVWGHPDMFQERVSEKKLGDMVIRRFSGIAYRREYLEFLGARFHLGRGFQEVADGIFLTGEVPRETSFEKDDPDLLLPKGEAFVPDRVVDDQSMVIRTSRGLVVVFGCAHSGMINTLHFAREKTGEERIHGVLGGTHLGFLGEEQLGASIEALKGMDPQIVGVSHCTGMRPAARLMQEFGTRFSFAHVGSSFQFD